MCKADIPSTAHMELLLIFRDEKSLTLCQAPSATQRNEEPDLAIQFIHHDCCQMVASCLRYSFSRFKT